MAVATSTILKWAFTYHDMGWSIIPIPHRGKAATIRWARFQSKRPDEQQLRKWFANGKQQNLAVVMGEVSGGLACRDFDTMDEYEKWANSHQDLAKVLPTVQTSRGVHVYFEGHIEGFAVITDTNGKHLGELRGSRCYCILPPSIHPSGSTYKWVVPLRKDNLHHFEPEQIQSTFCNIPSTHDTERTERTDENRGEQKRKEKIIKTAKIETAINETLPIQFGTRHRRIFDFARLLKSMPEYINADPNQFKSVVEEWHRRALPNINTKEFEETWIDFLMAWPRIKYRIGDGPLQRAFAKAAISKVPKIALRQYPENRNLQLLTALCRELQIIADKKPFFLSMRAGAKLFNIGVMTMYRWLFLLVQDDILKVTWKGGMTRSGRKASKYRYLKPLNLKAAKMENISEVTILTKLGIGYGDSS